MRTSRSAAPSATSSSTAGSWCCVWPTRIATIPRRIPPTRARTLRAQLPGKVVKLLVAEGDVVTAGQPLVILEAMKMETEVAAPRGGRVARVHVAAGRILAMGDPLLDLDPDQEPGEGE